MDYSNPLLAALRKLGQKTGLLRPAVRVYRKLFNIDYEAAFDRRVQSRIRPGDTVWDVGANVGHYCVIFSRLVGPNGKVVAIEPSPTSLPTLKDAIAGCRNVTVEAVALSDEPGRLSFFLSEGGDSVVEGLSRESVGANSRETAVECVRGDTLAAKHPPNVIKIDVEGFELETLEGVQETLRNPALHTVAIEVHFLVLAKRGKSDAPARLRNLLTTNGFKVEWTDPSHLVASR